MSERSQFVQEASIAVPTGRGEKHFQRVFDVNPDDRVLDLGSGASHFPTLENIVQFDHAYGTNQQLVKPGSIAVAGVYQELPFRDASFKRATMRFGAKWMSDESSTLMVDEALRVLETDGTLDVFTVHTGRRLKKTTEYFDKIGHEITYRIPKFMKIRGIAHTALVGASIVAGGVASKHGVEAGAPIAAFSGIVNTMLANFNFRSSVLSIKKNKHLENPSNRRIVAENMGPFIASEANVRI